MNVFIKNIMIIGVIFILLGTILMAAVGINTRSLTSDEICIIANDIQKISKNGHTLYVGGTGPNNYTHIQDAIDNASNGDTVFVYDDSSPYYEHVKVNKSISLVGENKETTIIDGSGSGDVVRITSDYVNISDFTIKNATVYPSAGIPLDHANYCNILDNNISNNHYGIIVYYSGSNNINGNNISSNWDEGICLLYSSNNTITGNNISSNGWHGIDLYRSSKNNINGNNISNNYDGLYLDFSNNSNISGNNISLNDRRGIHLEFSTSNNVSGNYILNNDIGIFLNISSNNIISSNDINSNNDHGIELDCSYFNVINYNNFIKNSRHAGFYYESLLDSFSNCWNRNYWGRPRILPKPIFGLIEVEAHPRKAFPWLNFDWLPLTEPYGGE